MKQISSAASKWRNAWRAPLSRDVIVAMRDRGWVLPPALVAWEREQETLAVCRQRAQATKAASGAEARRWLESRGVKLPHQLYDHQLVAVAFALQLPACGLFLDTGTGKTAVAATVMQALVDVKGYKRFLVIAPRSIIDVGWRRDLAKFSSLTSVNINDPGPREPVLTCPACGREFKSHVKWAHMKTHMARVIGERGEEGARDALYAKYPQLLPPSADDRRTRLMRALADTSTQVFVINPESFKIVVDELAGEDWDMIIVDESSMIKSPRAEITKKTIAFGAGIKRRVCMTATPRPNSSLDLWGQMAFLDCSLGGDFYRFREKYFFQSYNGYSWLPRTETTDHEIWDIVAQRSLRVKLDECVSLPGETSEQIAVYLEGPLAKHYATMAKEMYVALGSKEITTSHLVVQINKLAQITSGYIFDEQGHAEYLGASPKIKATVDAARRLIDEDRFVVIWVRFPHTEGREIEEQLADYGVSTLHGGTKNVEQSVSAFLGRRTRVMVAHVQSAKFGHTWTHANAAIFHSYDYSWENFYQAKRRIYRIGQTSPVTYIINTAVDTVDEVIMAKVFAKEAASEAVVDEDLFAMIRRRDEAQRK